MNLLRLVLIVFLVFGFGLCLSIGALAANIYVPSASTDVLSGCLTRSSITAGFTDALASTDGEEERKLLADALRSRLTGNRERLNLDDDDDNDVTTDQLKSAFAALKWAFDNPGWTPAQVFDITYQRCLKYNKERASLLRGGGAVGQVSL